MVGFRFPLLNCDVVGARNRASEDQPEMLAAHIGRVVVPHQLRVIAGDFFPDFMRGGLSAHATYLAFAGIRNKMLHGVRFPIQKRELQALR